MVSIAVGTIRPIIRIVRMNDKSISKIELISVKFIPLNLRNETMKSLNLSINPKVSLDRKSLFTFSAILYSTAPILGTISIRKTTKRLPNRNNLPLILTNYLLQIKKNRATLFKYYGIKTIDMLHVDLENLELSTFIISSVIFYLSNYSILFYLCMSTYFYCYPNNSLVKAGFRKM